MLGQCTTVHRPTLPAAMEKVRDDLEALLLLAQDSWVRGFMFGPPGASDDATLASAASNPSALSSRVVCSMTSLNIMEQSEGHAGVFDVDKDIVAVLVPHISAHGVTIGVVVQNMKDNAQKSVLTGSTERFCLGRFARENATGVLLTICDVPGLGCTDVHCVYPTNKGLKKMTRYHFRFNAPLFRTEAAQQFCTKQLDVSKFVPCIMFANKMLESRLCPKCRASPSYPCGCALPPTEPQHPFDFHSFCSVSTDLEGSYTGIATFNTFSSSTIAFTGRVSTHRTSNRILDTAKVLEVLKQHLGETSSGRGSADAQNLETGSSTTAICVKDNTAPNSPATGEKKEPPKPLVVLPSARSVYANKSGCPTRLVSAITPSPLLRRGHFASVAPRPYAFIPIAGRPCGGVDDATLRRRKQKREAAARSNAKRKQRNIALEESVGLGRQRVCELMERRKALVQENERLKSELDLSRKRVM